MKKAYNYGFYYNHRQPTGRPLTAYPPTHRPAIINLHQNRRPDSEQVLHSVILEKFAYCRT